MRWFRSLGLLYLPISVAGWITTILAAAFAVQVFLFVDSRSHSVGDTLYGVFPYWAPAFLLWAWLASRTSKDAA